MLEVEPYQAFLFCPTAAHCLLIGLKRLSGRAAQPVFKTASSIHARRDAHMKEGKLEQAQYVYTRKAWDKPLPKASTAQLVLIFAHEELITNSTLREQIGQHFPNAEIIGCTTSGEIHGLTVYDKSLCLTAITWNSTIVQAVSVNFSQTPDSHEAGRLSASMLPTEGLRHVLVFSDGHLVNGTELISAISHQLPKDVSITGGLAGDGERFEATYVWHNNKAEEGLIVLCGLYGDSLQIGYGSMGGWDIFGPERLITRATDNKLYELDGKSALELYKSYLGDFANQLPASALLFPLYVHTSLDTPGVVRTVLQIDEETQSMTFAGNIAEGSYAKLMRANYDRLIHGASQAASQSLEQLGSSSASLALLISCVGRRMVLKQRVEEEIEAVGEILGKDSLLCGFYSYGEICPLRPSSEPILHNQTMTITLFSEL